MRGLSDSHRMPHRAARCRWLVLGWALHASPGLAQTHHSDVPVSAELDWQRTPEAESCVEGDALQRAVEDRLGRTVFVENGPDVVLTGRVSRGPNGAWAVELHLASAQGQPMGIRSLETEAEDCSSLDDSLALVLAVMLDIPKADVPPPEPPVAREADPAEPTPKKPPPPRRATPLSVPKDTPPRREPWVVEVGAGAVGVVGLLPRASFGLSLRALVSPPGFWTLGLEAMALRSVDAGVKGSDAGANFSPKSLGVWLCPVSYDLLGVDTRACLVEHVGRLHVEGFGFDDNQKVARTYVNAGLRLDAYGRVVGPLGVTLTGGLDVPIVRETFRYGDLAGGNPQLYRMEPLVGFAQIGLAARFW